MRSASRRNRGQHVGWKAGDFRSDPIVEDFYPPSHDSLYLIFEIATRIMRGGPIRLLRLVNHAPFLDKVPKSSFRAGLMLSIRRLFGKRHALLRRSRPLSPVINCMSSTEGSGAVIGASKHCSSSARRGKHSSVHKIVWNGRS
jgi:hypothetical protein